LVPVPVDADPDALPQPGRFIDAEPDELSDPDELLFNVEDPGDEVEPLVPDELPADPLAAAPPDAPPLAPPDEPPLLWANATATPSESAMPVRGYTRVLSCMMRTPLPFAPQLDANVPNAGSLHRNQVCRKTVTVR
jgi:hypothetical protein